MTIDLGTYAERIDYRGDFTPTVETLRKLHLAHATHLTFENLDILLGLPIKLDLESLWAKLIVGRRGGYCFEQNAMFAAILEKVGFRVTRLAARVRMGSKEIIARTHMLLSVEAGGEPWLADVGFGGEGLLTPIRLRFDEETQSFAWKHRLILDPPFHVLQTMHPSGWFDLYAFTLEEQYPADYELANYFISTNPRSPFVNMIFVSRPEPEVHWTLMNRRLTEQRATGSTTTIVPDDDALLTVLAQRFGLNFPPGTRFRYDNSRTL
jgi:N-hydroxyarylamine O-acetyltransferase